MKWCLFLLSIHEMIILNNLVNTGQRMEQEKDTDTDERKKTVHYFL